MLAAIRFYQRALSPLTPPSCRFQPTCSTYMLQAIERFGAFRGFWMGVWRILRCHPFTRGGFDPVPEIAGGSRVMVDGADDQNQKPD